ncbi:hypothetical protein B0H63DRAFT_261450 [Podospora didyma]|uniref:DUF4112 domain-containing protein n=1 Tax=Podospora didyma TaxID=330526 RepID=A0AAE0KDZ1_9PEZI|nr:hypothetical protein B0H63DRAFT_261450 [Podospora didyma]
MNYITKKAKEKAVEELEKRAKDQLEKNAFFRLRKDKRKTNSENPYYHKVTVTNPKNGKTKTKTVERPVPRGISNNDAKILRRVRKKAYRWDMGINCSCCFGLRFGWSAIIGLIPFIGDFLELFMSFRLVWKADKIDGGLPMQIRARMVSNIAIDFAIGFIPVLGDFVDAFHRANTKNAWLLDAYLEEKGKALERKVITNEENPQDRPIEVPQDLKAHPGDTEIGRPPLEEIAG